MCEFKAKHAKSTQEQIAEHFSSKWSIHIAQRTVGDVLKRKADWELENPITQPEAYEGA